MNLMIVFIQLETTLHGLAPGHGKLDTLKKWTVKKYNYLKLHPYKNRRTRVV